MISLFVSNTDTKVTSNNGSQIQLSLNPAIVLDPSKKWFASIYEMDVVYCFANIFTGVNDKFKYSEMKNGVLTSFTHTFSQGLYTWKAIQEEINRCTQLDVQNSYLFVLEPDTSTSHMYIHFMTTTCKLDCTGDDNMLQILGYDKTAGVLGPALHFNDYYEADNSRLNNIQNLYVLASFVSGSYQNSQAKNVLGAVTPDVAPYSTILYRPQQPIYVPVTQNVLDTITFQLVDQDNKSLNLGIHDPATDDPERWSMRIIIKEDSKI